MAPRATRDDNGLVLELASAEEVGAFLEDAERQDGFLLTLRDEPRLFQRETLRVRWGEEREIEVEAQVIQAFPASGNGVAAAFQLLDWASCKAAAQRLLTASSEEPEEGEALGVSPAFRIRAMTPAERAQLAFRANATERRILVRESTPPVLLALLANPRIEDDEVLAVVRSHHATGGIFQRVLNERRWRSHYPIRLAVAKNPKTPQPLALSLIPTLRRPDLQRMARSQDLREAVRREALRAVQKSS